MWPLENPARHDRLPGLVEESLNAVRIIRLTRYQDIKIVRKANQTAIKHPVCGARKSNSVGKNVRPARFHRPDMCGVDLRPATTVDELQSRDGASFVISVKNEPAKQPISNDPRRELHNPVALLLEHERRLSFICKSIDRMRHPRLIQSRQFRLMLVYANRYDAVEICCGYRPDCGLCSAGNAALYIQHASLYDTVWSAERNGIDEVEIAAVFDQRQIHAGGLRIRNNPFNLGDSKIAAGRRDFPRLVVDDPVTHTRLDTTEILARELVLFSRAIVVNRI